MMLNTDMCLVYDNNEDLSACLAASGKKKGGRGCSDFEDLGTPVLAQYGQCCAWSNKLFLKAKGFKLNGATSCGDASGGLRNACCSSEDASSYGDCDSSRKPEGPAVTAVAKFAGRESKWLDDYLDAWKIATNNGYDTLKYLDGESFDPEDLLSRAPVDCKDIKGLGACKANPKCQLVKVSGGKRRNLRARRTSNNRRTYSGKFGGPDYECQNV